MADQKKPKSVDDGNGFREMPTEAELDALALKIRQARKVDPEEAIKKTGNR